MTELKSQIEKRKKELFDIFRPVVKKQGYKFNTIKEKVDFLLESEVRIERKKGEPYCPCKVHTSDREYMDKIICPCIVFHKEEFDRMKRCWCGLFIRKEVADGSDVEDAKTPLNLQRD